MIRLGISKLKTIILYRFKILYDQLDEVCGTIEKNNKELEVIYKDLLNHYCED